MAGIKGPEDTQAWIGRAFPVSGCRLCSVTIQGKRPLISRIESPDDILLPLSSDLDVHSYLGVPVVFRDHVTGLIALYNSGVRPFTEGEARVAELFANQVAIALDNSHRVEQMERQAVSDGLTGLHNHRHFQESLAAEVSRAERYGEEFCLLMMDLDHFKSVNDTVGHQRGDEVLREVAAALKRCSRESDYLARYGGEEFAVILPRTPLKEARTVAQRVCDQVREIAETKMRDLNANDVEAAMKIVEGTARSMGIEVAEG